MTDNTGSSPENYSEQLLTLMSFSERLSWERKAANNFAWFKRRADALDLQYPDVDEEYIKEVEDNYRLMDGLSMHNYTHAAFIKSLPDPEKLYNTGINTPNLKIEHFDWVTPFIDRADGDQRRAKLNFIVTDSSKSTQNYIKEQEKTNLKNHFEKKLILPIRQLAALQWQAKNGVEDLFKLTPEERQQMQSDINASVESMLPADIMRFMKYGSLGPKEKQGQALAEVLSLVTDFKEKIDECYLHHFATAGAVLHTGIRRMRPFVDRLDLTKFSTGGTNNTYIDKNPWFKYKDPLHPMEIITKFSHKWNKEDWRKFDQMVRGNTGSSAADPHSTDKTDQFVMAVDFAEKKVLSEIDLRTEDGQRRYSQLLQATQGGSIKDFDKIPVKHLVWSSLAKMKEITRGYEDGVLRLDYFDEHYQFNPQNGDLKEKVIWVQQYCQAWKIGIGEEPIFTDCGYVPYSKRDITDPYESVSPFTGGYINDFGGHGQRRSPLSRVKPWIHAANYQMKVMRDQEATDIGKVVLMTVAAKPKGWSWEKLFEVVRATRFLPINTQGTGLTPMDVQFFREIDLGNLDKIIPRINYLNFLISRIAEGLANNLSTQGIAPASTSVANNQANLSRAYSQVYSKAAWLNKIAEHTLENLVYLGRMATKGGNIFTRYVLDDLSIANIDIDIDEIDDAYFGVKVLTEGDELAKVDIGKNLLLPFIQNKNLSFKLAIDTLYAATRGELLDIATEAEMQAQIDAAKSVDFQRMTAEQQQQKALEVEKMLLELKHNIKMIEDAQNNDAKKEMAALSSMTIAHGNDVDNNNENDYLESAREDREFKREELLVKDSLEREKLGLEDKWTQQELAILDKKVEAMARQQLKPPPKKKAKK